MTTIQIIIITFFSISALIGFWGSCFKDNFDKRIPFTILLFMSTVFLIITSIIGITEMNRLIKEKEKCPEYEKIENVYILKQ